MERRVLHVIDGSGYIFRAYYAIRSLTASSGEPTNATYGFATMIEKALREEAPTHLALAFDAGGRNFRHEMFDAYKGTRSPPPEDLVAQIPRIHEVSSCFRIKTFTVGGVEADDVIASLVRLARQGDFDVELITGDKDLMQLVDDHVRVYEPMKNQRFRAPEVEEKFGVPPGLIADALALAGDTSDNIPGVRGIGIKTAAKLLREHGGLDGVLSAAAAGAIKGKTGERIAGDAEAARLSRRLVALKDDVDLGVTLEDLRYPGADTDRLSALYTALDFRKTPSVGRGARMPGSGSADAGHLGAGEGGDDGDGVAAGDGGGTELARGASRLDVTPVRLVSNAEDLERFVGALRGAKRIAVELELSSTRVADAETVGLAVAIDGGMTFYLPFKCGRARPEDAEATAEATAEPTAEPVVLSWTWVAEALTGILEDREIEKVSTDLKGLTEFLLREGIVLGGAAFDSTIATFLLRPDDVNHGYASTARRYLNHEVEDRAAALRVERKRIAFSDLVRDVAARLVGERAQVGLAASHDLVGALVAADLVHVFRDVELALVPVLARIELAGVRIDVDRLKALSTTFSAQLKTLEKACFEAAGVEFNLGSPKQLQKILFEDLKLKVIKRTKTGPSTDHEVLEALAAEHPLPQCVLEHRQMQKLQSTYVEALPKMVCPATGRVHTVLSQTSAATGRLASNDPNLQNIPIRTELGRELRRVFVAEAGHALISVDYSQIELRVLAHFSKDDVLSRAFADGADVHTRTASVLFEVEPANVTREQRTQAKAVNFGVLYGMGAVRLARELKIPRRVATQFIESYYVRQPGVRAFLDETLERARSTGMVRTLLGRRRLVADIHSKNRGARAAAERVAINTPIQGSAADLMKLAMIRVDAVLGEEFPSARLLLQVHDELLLEAPEALAVDVANMVKREMERVFPLDVPLVANASVGATWDEAH